MAEPGPGSVPRPPPLPSSAGCSESPAPTVSPASRKPALHSGADSRIPCPQSSAIPSTRVEKAQKPSAARARAHTGARTARCYGEAGYQRGCGRQVPSSCPPASPCPSLSLRSLTPSPRGGSRTPPSSSRAPCPRAASPPLLSPPGTRPGAPLRLARPKEGVREGQEPLPLGSLLEALPESAARGVGLRAGGRGPSHEAPLSGRGEGGGVRLSGAAGDPRSLVPVPAWGAERLGDQTSPGLLERGKGGRRVHYGR